MKTYISAVDTAKMMRKALKESFGDVKFSVRADHNSIRVNWTDGPSAAQVEAVAYTFKGGYFDGMIDFAGSIYHMIDGKQVQFGAKYVFCNREYSDALIAKAIAAFCRKYAGNLTSGNIDPASLTVEAFRAGNLYLMQFPRFPDSVQCMIRAIAAKISDRIKVEQSKTAGRVICIGDDDYSRTHGSGFSSLPAQI